MTENQFWWASVEGRKPQVVEISKRLGLTWIFVTGTDECLEEDEVRLIERGLPAGRAAAVVAKLQEAIDGPGAWGPWSLTQEAIDILQGESKA